MTLFVASVVEQHMVTWYKNVVLSIGIDKKNKLIGL